MKCPRCSFDNTPAGRFCAACGVRLTSDAPDGSAAETMTLAEPEERFPTGMLIAGRYRVVEEIGRGGMGVVYKVVDEAVGEKVALKVINPEIARKRSIPNRFRNELKSARRISHRNVCRMHDLGEHEGLTYLTMEYVSGESLRKIIRMTGPLSVATAIAYARQICRGMAEAHALGVIHRDLKPHNIMIDREGTAKIMDFGIARSPEGEDLTEPGARLGTPRYMAPEQAEEGRADERSDIFALGLVLYEMVTGHPPSRDDASRPVVPPRSLAPFLSRDVEAVIMKCLEKNPDRRYATAAELQEALESLIPEGPARDKESPSGVPGRTARRRIRRLWPAVAAVLGSAIVLAGAAFLILGSRGPSLTLAVLPFDLTGGGEDPDFPAGSLADNIRAKLSEIKWIRVISKGSSEQLPAAAPDMKLAHRRLGADRVIGGALRREGDSRQLEVFVSSADGSALSWSRRYRFEAERQFRLEDEIVLDIAEALDVPVGDEAVKRFGLREPSSQDAYRHFQWGESFQKKYRDTGSEEDFAAALENYQQAVSLDAGYALAYWGMGNLYEFRYVQSSEARDLIRMLDGYEAAFKANPRLAEPYLGRGWALYYERKFDQAHENFRTALRIDPDNPDVQLNAGSFLRSLGLFREALTFYEAAVRLNLDPLNTMPHRLMAFCHGYLGETDRAVAILRRALALEPSASGIHLDLARMHLLKGEAAEARKELEAAERLAAGAGALARLRVWLLAAEGRREEALKLLPGIEHDIRYEVTNAYCLLGMKAEAVRNIALGVESGFRDFKEFMYTYEYLSGNPLYGGLRSRADYEAVLEAQKRIHRERREKFGGL